MKNLKRVFAVMAIVSAIIIAMPNTISLFGGQHGWYDKESLPCQKCHADIAAELKSESNSHPPSNADPVSVACVLCHKVEPIFSAGNTSHASVLVPCDSCHYPEASSFDNDSHFVFVNASEQNDLMSNGTEACIGCHTNATFGITYNVSQGYEIELNKTCDWDVGNFTEANYSEVVI